MKYTVTKTSDTTWEVEEEDDEVHYVRYDIFKDIWICDCLYNGITEKCCKHILYAKQNLVFGITEFNDEFISE
jgi:hypothetical protein